MPNDLRGAANLYRRVEILGEKLAEAFYAQARVAAALGDTAEQARTLDKMFELAGTDTEPTPAQVDALYRLAEIFLGSDTRRKQGFELLERAFAAEPRWGQAGRLLKAAAANASRATTRSSRCTRASRATAAIRSCCSTSSSAAPRLPARRRSRSARPSISRSSSGPGRTRRGAARARRRRRARHRRWSRLRAVGRARARRAPARRQRSHAGARPDLRDRADRASAEQIDGLAMRIATRALAHRKIDLAADVYEFLRERSPADRAVWQPLLTIYRELGDGDRLGSVVSSTLPALVTPAERNALRLEHAKFLIENLKRHHDALDVLRDSLKDDPDNLEAAAAATRTRCASSATTTASPSSCGRGSRTRSAAAIATRRSMSRLRLGDLLEKTGSPDAVRVYRAALIVAPDDREILRRVVGQLGTHDNPREGALLMERLLAVESPGARARARRQARDDVGGRRRLQGRAAHARARAQVGARRHARSTIGSSSGTAITSSGPSSPS